VFLLSSTAGSGNSDVGSDSRFALEEPSVVDAPGRVVSALRSAAG